jgi:hypothetical protein
MIKKFFIGMYMVTIYTLCLVLAIVSAGFTTVFYTSGAEGTSQVLIGLLAIVLEAIKIILAFVFPFMVGKQGAETIRRVLNACLILSIIASLNFFMSLGTSPAAGFVTGIYDLIGVEFGKDFLTFMLNMTLAVIIEVFVIHVPRFAHVFSAREVKEHRPSALAKLISIPRWVIERKIDNWVALVNPQAVENAVEVKAIEIEEKPLAIEEAVPVEEIKGPLPVEAIIENYASTQAEESKELEADSQADIIHDISEHTAPEKWKNLVNSAGDLLKAFISIKDADNIIQYKAAELEEAFAISNWNLRQWKKVLASEGKIETVGGNKIKVVA